jgi:redox-sensitive bicupin YhaK (pirin superfamily)
MQCLSKRRTEFHAFAHVLDGEASFGANKQRAKTAQLVLLGRGDEVTVNDAAPSTRFMLFAGKPYGEDPIFNGPFVD